MVITARNNPFDEHFFAEWRTKAPGSRRSLERARRVADVLGILDPAIPVLSVVGSKGKGTAATYAAAALTAAGVRTVLVTSPSFLENTERIRVDGERVSDAAMDDLGRRVTAAAASVRREDLDYLSPTGSFTLAGVLHARLSGAQALVLEEGLGGASDEISLFPPDVLAVTRIFLEHQDLLGGDVETIARDLLGVVGPGTREIVTLEQDATVLRVLEEHSLRTTVVNDGSPDIPGVRWPHALSRMNAKLGVQGATVLLGQSAPPDDELLVPVLNSITLPGRLSTHRTSGGLTWLVDAAISPAGVDAALDHCRRTGFRPDIVLASFPNGKDVTGCYAALGSHDVVPVAAASSHLKYSGRLHPRGLVTLEYALARLLPSHKNVLALGTISFIGEVLDHLQADTRRLYRKV
jgi:dihydrofolate synthase/folylpolyglutamate synthase